MNEKEAARRLNDGKERRFFLQKKPPMPVVIVDREVTKNPNHEEIADELIKKGEFSKINLLSGGYCIALDDNELKYWGVTAGSLPSATKEQFDKAVDENEVKIVS